VLSTALAATALRKAGNSNDIAISQRALYWIAMHQNHDGGFGDTPESPSNIQTSLICLACLKLCDVKTGEVYERLQHYCRNQVGDTPTSIVNGIRNIYKEDQTFATPILGLCAMTNMVPYPKPLPFELSILPRSWLHFLKLEVVSYALPALIAVGLCLYKHSQKQSRIRDWIGDKAIKRLNSIQPESGGFLEAIPLTAFVIINLQDAFQDRNDLVNDIVKKGLNFLRESQLADGSWAIDVDLSVWVTTQSIWALGSCDDAALKWILERQQKNRHPFTDTPPGGWGWSWRSGSVPDGDDTASALIALALRKNDVEKSVVNAGFKWLKQLQNKDGGFPTFCRGWNKLPFDKSTPDVTAHVIRAYKNWGRARDTSVIRAHSWLEETQQKNGSWLPLWFGSQLHPHHKNPVYGTSRVVTAIDECDSKYDGVKFLVDAQDVDGGWGGDLGLQPTFEETGLALCALANTKERSAVLHGAMWLAGEIISKNGELPSSPIGLYFSNLWYDEQLYPLIWSLKGLDSVIQTMQERNDNKLVFW